MHSFTHSICHANKILYEIVGAITNYLIQQVTYSLLFYCIFLCWATVFPFNYKDAKSSGNLKYVFVSSVIMCFLFPMVSLVVLKDGYYAANYFFAACTARNSTDFYVIYTLHMSLLMWINSSLFVIIIWTIFKVSVPLQLRVMII